MTGAGRRLTFEIEATDEIDTISRSRYQRLAIDRDRFANKAANKRHP